jgi:hypothetical protein
VRPVNLRRRHYFDDNQVFDGTHATDVEEGTLATRFPETAAGDRASSWHTVVRP